MPVLTVAARKNLISAYSRNGYALFNWTITSDGKKVPVEGWRKTENDPFLDSTSLSSTYGVNLQEDDCVLDVDPRRFKDGVNQLEEMWKLLKLPPSNTFIVKSGAKGCHMYFKKPPGIKLCSRVPGFDAIEIKSAGQWVAGAGSLHNKGTHYLVLRGDLYAVEEAPGRFLEYSERANNYDVDGEQDFDDNDEGNRKRFILYCLHTAPAIEGEGGDLRTIQVAQEARDYGLDEHIALEIMLQNFNPRCQPEWSEDELQIKVSNAYMYAKGSKGSRNPIAAFESLPKKPKKDLTFKEAQEEQLKKITWTVPIKDALKPVLSNISNYFLMPKFLPRNASAEEQKNAPDNPLFELIRYNDFANTIEFMKAAPWHKKGELKLRWDDNDTLQVKNRLARIHTLFPSTQLITDAIIIEAQQRRYHPVLDYLEGLIWDGVSRLNTFLSRYVGSSQNLYTQEVGKSTLIGAVARIYKPGFKHDSMIILEGEQGNGKTEFVKTLGGEWYADIPIDTKNKDTIQNMQGAWILEASEMEFIRREEVKAFKAFLTRVRDDVRLPYGRFTSYLPRQSIFIGTVNPDATGEYLTDNTGNRRFWPVPTTKIDIEQLRIDRDQLFAEAVYLFKNGGYNYLRDSEVMNMATIEQELRSSKEAWGEIIEDWLARTITMQPKYLTTSHIAFGALNIQPIKYDKIVKNRVAQAMKSLGYEMHRTTVNRQRVYFWLKDNLKGV
jgi:predicted P-loop ATPase